LKAQDQKAYILGTPLGQGPAASTSEALEEAVYAMNTGDVTKTPVKVGENWLVVGVKNREEANMDDFAKQRDQLVAQMLQQKRSAVFTDYLAATRRKLESDGSIIIYSEALAKADAPEMPFGASTEQ
jgi:parvulin-like peptidyl-prolyl isomerase